MKHITTSSYQRTKSALPSFSPGFGLRSELAESIGAHKADIGFLEITPENYLSDVRSIEWLEKYAAHFPLISHSVSISLGSVDELNEPFLRQIRWFTEHFKIPWFSDHLSFSSVDNHFTYDLFPLPFTKESARYVADRILRAQDIVGLPLIIENIPYYIDSPPGELSEAEFISSVAEYADCGLLLDVNNLVVNSINHRFDALTMLKNFPLDRVVQIHLAGHSKLSQRAIDNHGSPIDREVYDLLEHVLLSTSVNGIMIERDQNFPPFEELMDELQMVKRVVERSKDTATETMAQAPTPSAINLSTGSSTKQSDGPTADQISVAEELLSYERFFLRTWDKTTAPCDINAHLDCNEKQTVPASSWSGLDTTGIGVYAWLRDQTRMGTMLSMFPCTARVLKDYRKAFSKYFQRNVPKDRDILKMGDSFPDFVTSLIEREKAPPFARELADFERTRHRLLSVQSKPVYAAIDIELDSFEFLAANRPVVVPGLELRHYQFPVAEIYSQVMNAGVSTLEFERKQNFMAIFPVYGRWQPQVLSLSQTAKELLTLALERKKSYLQLIGALAGKNATPAELAAVIKLLKALHDSAILTSYESLRETGKSNERKQSTWLDYHEAMKSEGAHHTLENALADMQEKGISPGVAVDIGAGCGRDACALLEAGWQVTAIDAEPTALLNLKSAMKEQESARFSVVKCKMEEVELPKCNLVNASLSLPFCDPLHFDRLWDRITQALQAGGYFCGHLFGPRDEWANAVTVVSKEALEKMLESFEIISIQESYGPLRLADGGYKQGHIFSVVARKR